MVQDQTATDVQDAYLWLEDIYGEKPLAWVGEQNDRTLEMLAGTDFEHTRQQVLEVLDSTDRIPMVGKHGDFYYNFWRDAEHPKGIWRRTTLEEYRKADPAWELVLDLDALAADDGTEWVWHGADIRSWDNARALLRLSPDGGDASAIREFDLSTMEFVDSGFELPIAKTMVADWLDDNTLIVATDTGAESLTTSTYPRMVRKLVRGQELADAEVLLEVDKDHMMAVAQVDTRWGYHRLLLIDTIGFYTRKFWLVQNGETRQLDVPEDARVEFFREHLLITPKSAWNLNGSSYQAGTLLAANLDSWLSGDRTVNVLYEPDATSSLSSWSGTQNHLLLTTMRDVSSAIQVLTPTANGWQSAPLGSAPELHTIHAGAVDADSGDDYFMMITGYLTPSTLLYGTVGGGEAEVIKSAPAFFDASRYQVEQHFVTSKDGTRVPYFQVSARNLQLDGTNPTLLYGYGGFEISLTPSYSGDTGRGWLDRGGVYVVANIRGGGEYGPEWHTSVLQQNRPRAYEDFAAVAQDLIDRKVTSPAHLACQGGSNGGLLVGNMLTHYPHLFGAIACMVPLLDMRRYTKLSAGYSWIAEYGDPDKPEQWEYVRTFSPYHNLRAEASYPAVLFYTATSDDRVGPVQARKMAARMQEMRIPDVWFFENREGGHGGGADNRQLAHMRAAVLDFLWSRIGTSADH